MKKLIFGFSKTECILWLCSILLITVPFLLFDRVGYLNLIASLIGVTSLILCAKGNPIGQALIIIFCLLYGYISFRFSYYGEMITYLGMTMPMAILALISWLKNPYGEGHSEVKVNSIKKSELWFACALTALVTLIFYFILRYFNTAYLPLSTLSVTTSFFAIYLTYRRSPYFALAYAANDVVLIILWLLAGVESSTCVSVAACFIAFLLNDIYGFINWQRMKKRQTEASAATP